VTTSAAARLSESVAGPGHFSALRPVFPDMQLVAAGGLDAGNARDFIAAGVGAVAFGSSVAGGIAGPGLIKELHEQIAAFWRLLPPGRASGPGTRAEVGEGSQVE
jgi:2-keto-3-deoxy-6-phosphogluconate aldolase